MQLLIAAAMKDIIRVAKNYKTKIEIAKLGLPLGNDRDDMFRDNQSANFSKIRKSISAISKVEENISTTVKKT